MPLLVRDTARVDGLLDLVAASGASVEFIDGSMTTGAELAAEGLLVAGWLARQGVERGDRVAIRQPNGADWIRLLIGCAASGAIAVAVNTRYGPSEAADLIRRTGARTIDMDDSWRSCVPAAAVGGRDDPLIVFTTSGTTSRPKMVVHDQASIVDHAIDVGERFGYSADDVVLVAMPLCGTFGSASFTGALAAGARLIVTDFDLDAVSRWITDRRVTCANGSDDMFHRLVERGCDLSSIRLGGYARFNTSLDGIVDRAAARGATLTGLYGMSEVQALFGLRDPDGSAEERERAGGTLTSPRASYRIVDGELQLRGPSMFAGYLAEGGARIDTDLTGRHFDDGWFRTGDLAEADGERSFHYVARLGDTMRLGGFLVAPREIESALVEYPGIDGAQVVAVDRPTGARPVGFVIASEPVDERALIEHCRRRLARFKTPVRVLVIDEFPTVASANGTKIQRSRLRVMAADALSEDGYTG